MSLRDWYMVGVDEDNMVKNKMQKRLRQGLKHSQFFNEDDEMTTTASMAAMHHGLELESLAGMVGGVMSDDKSLQLEMITGLKKLLSKPNPPINEVVQTGVVPRIVPFLSDHDFPQLQSEAAWVLINVASGTSENTKVIIDTGAVPLLIKLISSSSTNEDVREQAVWALGNVAGDNIPQFRDFVLSQGAMFPLLALFNDFNAKLSMLRNATWTLGILCQGGNSKQEQEQILPALPVLQRLVHSRDKQVLTYACWALTFLSDGTKDKIQNVLDSGVIPPLIQILACHPSELVLIQALITIGNLVSGDDMQTQALLNFHPLPALLKLLTNTSKKKSIIKETCWIISNITAGNTSQVQEVIQSGLIHPLIHLLQQGEFDIKKEAAWPILNATCAGNHDQIKFLVSQGCIKPLCDLLTCSDTRFVMVCLKGLQNILMVGEAEKNVGNAGDYYNLYAHMINEAQGLEKIKNLQSHDHNNEIKDKAAQILKTFWAEDDDVMVCDDVGEAASESNGFGNQNGPTGGGLSSLLERFFL